MRISDWSSDVCSSDLSLLQLWRREPAGAASERPGGIDRHRLRDEFGVAGVLPVIIGAPEFGVFDIIAAEALERRSVGGPAVRDPAIVAIGHRLNRVGRGIGALAEQALEIGADDRKSTRLNSSHYCASRMPSSARKKKNLQLTLRYTTRYPYTPT